MKICNKTLLILITATALLLLFGKTTASAAENEYPYTYTIQVSGHENDGSYEMQDTYYIQSPQELVCYISSKTDTNTSFQIRFYDTKTDALYSSGVTARYTRTYKQYRNGELVEANSYTDKVFENSIPKFGLSQSDTYIESYTTTLKVFENYNDALAYCRTGDDSAQINKPDIDLDVEGILDTAFSIPKLSVDNTGYGFTLNNGADDLYFEMRGRWYSVDDIELYKENAMWKYKYDTFLKSDLTTWVSVKDKVLSTGKFNFHELGKEAFENFIAQYPVDNRTYTGGTNALGNWFRGYNDALSTLKMLLAEPTSIYNGVEVYIRYFYYDESGKAIYSKWTHYYDNLANASGSTGSVLDDEQNMYTENQSQSGLTNEEFEKLEGSGNSRNDADAVPTYKGETIYIFDDMDMSNFKDTLDSMAESIKEFPVLIAKLFSWLPAWVIGMIAFAIGAVVLLRFLGR